MSDRAWPVTETEQQLLIDRLEKHVSDLEAIRSSIVLHSYAQPTDTSWEQAYLSEIGGTLPIPPGLRLCWLNMRTGQMVVFSTAFDLDGGTASSGRVYPYGQTQNTSVFRYLGGVEAESGYFVGPESNTHAIRFGANIPEHQKRGLFMVEGYIRFSYPVKDLANSIWLDLGDLVYQLEHDAGISFAGVYGAMSHASTFSGTDRLTTGQQVSPEKILEMTEGPDTVDGATDEDIKSLLTFRLFDPFQMREGSGLNPWEGSTGMQGLLVHPEQALGDATTTDQIRYVPFNWVLAQKRHLYENFRVYRTTDTATGADNTLTTELIHSTSHLYGWYVAPTDTLLEYPDGI